MSIPFLIQRSRELCNRSLGHIPSLAVLHLEHLADEAELPPRRQRSYPQQQHKRSNQRHRKRITPFCQRSPAGAALPEHHQPQ